MSVKRMKGGGSTNSTVTQTTTDLPAYAKPYWETLMARVADESTQPWTQYQGDRNADMSPYQQEAYGRMVEMGQSGDNQSLIEAARLAYNVGNDQFQGVNTGVNSGYNANPMYGMGNYDPQQRQSEFYAGRLNDPQMVQSYMSPYMQNVVDVEKREAARQADTRHQQLGLGAARQGGLGGYRDAIMRSENERNLTQQMADIQTKGQQSAWQDAKASYEADRAARAKQEEFGQSQFGLNAQERQYGATQELNQWQNYEQAQQKAAELGLSAQQGNQQAQIALMNGQVGYQQNQLGASDQLARFAEQQQQMELERLGLLRGAGEAQQQQQQAYLDTMYQDFRNQQAYPLEMLSFFNNMLHGAGMTPGQTQAVYGQDPTTAQSLLGGGIAAAGLYNGAKGGQQ